MKIHYREHAHAVTTNDRYGYYRQIEYNSPKSGTVVLETKKPEGEALWPVTLYMKVTVHNHEDLTYLTDMILNIVDEARGEFGENEARSPSSWKLPGDWRDIAMYKGKT
jgi:hypothetical protein